MKMYFSLNLKLLKREIQIVQIHAFRKPFVGLRENSTFGYSAKTYQTPEKNCFSAKVAFEQEKVPRQGLNNNFQNWWLGISWSLRTVGQFAGCDIYIYKFKYSVDTLIKKYT